MEHPRLRKWRETPFLQHDERAGAEAVHFLGLALFYDMSQDSMIIEPS